MASREKSEESEKPKRPSATTPEGRELQLQALAFDQAELQFREGVAPAPVTIHFLKLASERNQLELEKLRLESLHLIKKNEQIDMGERIEELFSEAIKHMTIYRGDGAPEDYEGYID